MKREKGFTLIELVMVIVILGILSAVAIPKYVDMQDEARSATAKGVIGTVRSAIAIQYANNALSGNAIFPTVIQLRSVGTTSIFVEGKMADSPVPANSTHLNDIRATNENPITTISGNEAYVYNQTSGEIRYNNPAIDPITGKAWSTF